MTSPLRLSRSRVGAANAVLIWCFVIIIISGLLVGYNYMVFRNAQLTKANQMPPVKEVPGFALKDQSDATVTRADFVGQPWVANFIFTRCPGPCGLLSQQMQKLQETLPEEIKLVSFTVDPEFDTPPVLSEYAEGHGAEPGRWYFLTGDQALMKQLIVKGFQVAVGKNDEAIAETEGLFIHSTHLVLVDSKGMIRRYYEGTNPEAVKQLKRDLEWLRSQEMAGL